jgi:hypothetical protein
MRKRLKAFLDATLNRLIELQTKRPFQVLAVALVTVLVCGYAASHLTIRTSISELLPEKQRSVVVANQVSERVAAASVLVVAAESEDTKALEQFVDALSPELRALPPELVGSVEDGVRDARAFFEANKLLYAPLSDVREVHDAVVKRYEYEVGKATGTDLGEEEAPPPINASELRARIAAREREASSQYRDGYYLERDGKLIAIVVHTAVASGDIDRSIELKSRVEAAIARVDPARFDAALKVTLAGDFIEALEENQQVKRDLGEVGAAGIALILGVVFLFYLRFRALAAMALTALIGVVWTFGLARLLVGNLNSSTGFLVTIVTGNGINFGIIYMARYLTARKTEPVAASVRAAHTGTWAATFAAAGSATVAYGSLMATDCRAFRQFGEIGGTGMLLCWVATYLFLPAILVASERIWPVSTERSRADQLRGAYGRPFAYLIQKFSGAIAVGSVILTVGSIALGVHYLRSDPMEYNLSHIRTEMAESRARQLEPRIGALLGRGNLDGIAILTDDTAQAIPLRTALLQKRDAAPAGEKPFDQVITVFDFVPADQEEKLGLIAETQDKLSRAHRRGLIPASDWAEIEPLIQGARATPIGIQDLPIQVARPFTEKDGTRGRVVYVTPAQGRTLGDARYLLEWADSFRETTLADGRRVEGSGRSVIFADLIRAVLRDAPRTVLLSLGLTSLIVVLAFRGRRAAFIALGTLLAGLAWMLGFLALWGAHGAPGHLELVGMKLNFLNFIALPISIGVGADYAVNMVQRRARLTEAEILKRVIETGGAVVLCSLTTMLGYLALTLSGNQAIRSFGVAAAAGEVACVLAAVLVLPAWLVYASRAQRAQRSSARSPEHKAPLPAEEATGRPLVH